MADLHEHHFHGHQGAGDVALVSMPGGADDVNKCGVGVQFHRAISHSLRYNFSMAVMHETAAEEPDFWVIYTKGLKDIAQGKSCLVVLTKEDGTIGKVQAKEIAYILKCNGQDVTGEWKRPNLLASRKIALTCDEFEAWCRVSAPDPPRLDKLGCEAPQSGVMYCLPCADIADLRFRRLASGVRTTGVLDDRLAADSICSLALISGGSLCQWSFDVCLGCPFYYEDAPTAPPGQCWVAVAAGDSHFVALASDGFLHQWGSDNEGQRNGLPAALPPGERWVALAACCGRSLALASDGSLHQWGKDVHDERKGLPAAPPPGERWVALAAGSWHSLALASDGSLRQWGGDSHNQRRGLPAAPPPGERWVALAAGGFHSLALASDGSLHQWGDDMDDQRKGLPAPGKRWVSLAAGMYHSLALASDGSLHQWGSDFDLQRNGLPTAPPPGERWVTLAAGGLRSLALASGGSLCQWGHLVERAPPMRWS